MPVEQAEVISPRLHTVAQFAERFPAWSQPALRALILCAQDRFTSGGDRISGNGLAEAGAIVRVGRGRDQKGDTKEKREQGTSENRRG